MAVKVIHTKPEEHSWQEGYYGYECICGEFIPYGCEPWMPDEDELIKALRGACDSFEEIQRRKASLEAEQIIKEAKQHSKDERGE